MQMQVCAQGTPKNSLNKTKLYAVSSACHQICFGFVVCLVGDFCLLGSLFGVRNWFVMWSAALTSFLSWESTFSFPSVHVKMHI